MKTRGSSGCGPVAPFFLSGHDVLQADFTHWKRRKAMIELNAVTKRYGSLTAVDNISLTVKQGEYMALLGPNGAGKTTIVKMLLDFTGATAGRLTINGIASTDPACRTAVGYLAENPRLPPHLSGWQYLRRSAELLAIPPETAISQCLQTV